METRRRAAANTPKSGEENKASLLAHNDAMSRNTEEGYNQSVDLNVLVEDLLGQAPLPMSLLDIVNCVKRDPRFAKEATSADETTPTTEANHLKDRDLEEEVASLLRKRKRFDGDGFATGKFFKKKAGLYYLSSREPEIDTNLLITKEYQELGMELLLQRYRYIPIEVEHRFYEYKRSTIPGAGHGLFVRKNRMIRCGTIALEYYGEFFSRVPSAKGAWMPYMIKLQGDKGYINGVDVQGRLLSLAPFVNDAGPQLQNVELMELEDIPGKVFIVALRDIFPGEELFATYGASYWGMQQYETQKKKTEEVATTAKGTSPSSKGEIKPKLSKKKAGTTSKDDDELELNPEFFESGTVCRTCRVKVPRRATIVHATECNDPKCFTPIKCLNSLPFTTSTSISYGPRALWRSSAQRSYAARFVEHKMPLTAFNSHAEFEEGDDNDVEERERSQ